LRNEVGEEAMAEDNGVLSPGLAPKGENDDDTRDNVAALFGIDLEDGYASPTLIELDGDGGEGATVTGNSISNGYSPPVAGNGNVGKHKSLVWDDFEEIFETVNRVKICTKATCKMCKTTLSARSSAGTNHLKGHQKSCRQKLINVLGFSLGLLTILMVLCITGNINLMLLDLSCVA
jgi:hypothetical protein